MILKRLRLYRRRKNEKYSDAEVAEIVLKTILRRKKTAMLRLGRGLLPLAICTIALVSLLLRIFKCMYYCCF